MRRAIRVPRRTAARPRSFALVAIGQQHALADKVTQYLITLGDARADALPTPQLLRQVGAHDMRPRNIGNIFVWLFSITTTNGSQQRVAADFGAVVGSCGVLQLAHRPILIVLCLIPL